MIELNEWLEYRELNKGQSASTMANYRATLLHFGEWLAREKLSPTDVDPATLQRYTGEVLHRKGLSPNSRRIAVSALRGYYRHLAKKELVRRNPADELPYPTLGRKLPVPISLRDAEKLMAQPDLDTFKGVRDLAILAVLVGIGPRISGVANLNEGDLIFTQRDSGLEDLTILLREKGKHERLMPAPEETRLALRAYLGHEGLDTIDRDLPSGDRVLFVNIYNSAVPAHEHRGENRRMGKGSMQDMIKDYGRTAEVDPKFLHPHAMRHLYGAELAESETDLLVRQKLLGHTDPKSTAIYSHIAMRKLRKAATEANPMRRMKTPLTGLAGLLRTGR